MKQIWAKRTHVRQVNKSFTPARVPNNYSELEMNPHTAAPISTTRMFAPGVMLTRAPSPVVGMNNHAIGWGIGVGATNMPALAFTIADH